MTDWMSWLVAAGILVVAELFTGTFYLLMIAIGLGAGALAALSGASGSTQTFVAAVVGLAATAILHRSRFGRPARSEASRDRNVNIDIGQRVVVSNWQDGRARAMYRGALWDIELGPGAQPEAGDFRIVEVLGSRLIVSNA
ncbi:NfeD family protein [Telluria aromaticivorans]|uniref:NfeD family protein n=1 Tax=Telluria aromaticivorans TaxID=2725995 RepID=A0A7Y2NYQ5_9BURK|nr:NfeD family protein [Telluria aromaticivorans]NNG21746.1 NfeD family protein [Telluria aromaticivorans]